MGLLCRKRVLEEQAPDDVHVRKTEIKEEKARIFMIGGERIWGTELKNDSLTMKFTFVGNNTLLKIFIEKIR